jgi:hypothetical protein
MSVRLFCGFAFGVAAAWLAGCATSPVELTLAEPVPAATKSGKTASRMVVGFSPIEDLRPEFSRHSVGIVAGREVKGSDVLHWVDHSLAALTGEEFAVSGAANPGGWNVKPSLRQLYTAGLSVSKSANIVIELEIQPPSGPPSSHVYRGRITAMNWWGSADEIKQSVADALADCLHQMAADLDRMIRADKVGAAKAG